MDSKDVIDTQQVVLAATEKAQHEKAMDAEAMVKVEAFLLQNAARVRQWVDANPGQRPPVYYDEGTDKVVWETRKERRKKQSPKKLARDLSRRSQIKAKMELNQRMVSNLTVSNNKPEAPPKEAPSEQGQDERPTPP